MDNKNKENNKEKDTPVIIRRKVVLNEKETVQEKGHSRSDFGKIEKNTQKDYNIVYKEKDTKTMSISELFGLNKKKKEEPTVRKEKLERITTENKEIKKAPVKQNKKDSKTENKVADFKKNNLKENKKPNNSFVNNQRNTLRDNTTSLEQVIDKDKEKYERRKKDRPEKEKIKEQKKISKKQNFDDEFDEQSLEYFKGVSNISDDMESGKIFEYYDVSEKRKNKNKSKKIKKEKPKQAKLTKIILPETISVKNFAQELKISSSDILKKLMDNGIITNINSSLDFETAYLIAQDFGVEVTKKNEKNLEQELFDESEDTLEELQERPPVVVVMGHVDHGKTSLLDAIKTEDKNVTESEFGGITQHIGAYQVKVKNRLITFLDTPGHEAFTQMRARGAQITDIAILVVAANDGIMPQTVEAINHAKQANIPIIVAINKIDLPGANVQKVKETLMNYDIVPEEWGGQTICVPISAKEGTNIDTLLEMVLLQADMLELKANPNKQAKGTVIEARLDKSKGPVVSMLVRRGTLNVGDTVVIDKSIGRIRTMKDYKGRDIKEAYPSMPVEVSGITTLPMTGDTFYEVTDEKMAKKLVEKRISLDREKMINEQNSIKLEDLFNQIQEGKLKTLNIIIKADVLGTAEALKKSLEDLSNDEIRVKVIHSNVGAVNESDINLAKVSGAIIVAFNVVANKIAKQEAEKEKIEIKQYTVIYAVIDEIENAMIGMLEPEYKEQVIGTAEVRKIFKISKIGNIAGCMVTTGKINRNAGVRVIRDNIIITETKIDSLKREKDDVKSVSSGYECGILLDGFNELTQGDILEVFEKIEIKRELKKKENK